MATATTMENDNESGSIDITNSTLVSQEGSWNDSVVSSDISDDDSVTFADSLSSLSRNSVSPIIAQPSSLPSPINTHQQNDPNELTSNGSITCDYSEISCVPETQQSQQTNFCSDSTLVTTKSCSAAECLMEDNADMIQCSSCQEWRHYVCTSLPDYQIYAFTSTSRRYECISCVTARMPDDEREHLMNLRCSIHCDSQSQTKPRRAKSVGTQCDSIAAEQEILAQIDRLGQSLKNDFAVAVKSLEANLLQSRNKVSQDLLEQQLQTVNLQLEECKRGKSQIERDLAAARKKVREYERSRTQEQPEQSECVRCPALAMANKTAARKLNDSELRRVELESEVDALKADIATTSTKLNKKRSEEQTMKANISTLEEQLETSKTEASALRKQISDLKSRTSSPKSELADSNDHMPTPPPAELNPHPINSPHPAPNASPSSADSHYPDLLIIGNSNTSQIKADKIYKNKSTKVITLKNKTIEGALDYVESSTLNPRVVILQVAGNNLAQTSTSVEDTVAITTTLLTKCRDKFPDAQIFLGQPLPRKLRSNKATDSYKNKVDEYICQLSESESPPSIITFPTMKEVHHDTFHQDGIHLNARGIGRLITTYKISVGDILGVPYGIKRGQSQQQQSQQGRQTQQRNPSKNNFRQYQKSPSATNSLNRSGINKMQMLFKLLNSMNDNAFDF